MKLRRASLQWPERNLAIKTARMARGMYKCAECGDTKYWGPKEIHLDHINPVQPVGIEIDLVTWIYRLLCVTDGFQVLCHSHHQNKTLHENMLRDIRKRTKRK